MDTSIRLTDIESQPVDDTVRIKQQIIKNERCFAKTCIATTSTLLLSPFAIGDMYYACTDSICVNQSNHYFDITMYSYLISSGIFTFVFIGALNVSIFIFDINLLGTTTTTYRDGSKPHVCLYVGNYIVKAFHLVWLIVGCVLFWGHMNTSICMDSTYHYLFARFVITSVLSVSGLVNFR